MSNRGGGGWWRKGSGEASLSWQDDGNSISIGKNCLNAEVHATRKYNWLIPLAGSLIQELL